MAYGARGVSVDVVYTIDLSLKCGRKTSAQCKKSESFSMHTDRVSARVAAERAGWHVGRTVAVCGACLGNDPREGTCEP
jgi:hypothetical protein